MQADDLVLVEVLKKLLASGGLVRSTGYGKSQLLRALTPALGDGAELAFSRLRSAASGRAALRGLTLRVERERRGSRYFFESEPDQDTLSSPPATSTPRAPASAGLVAPPAMRCGGGSIDIFVGDNLPILRDFEAASFDLIYIDPPFNTGRTQARTQISTSRDEDGDRVGFQGKRYRTTRIGTKSFADTFDDFLEFLAPRLEQAHRLLRPTGSFFLHLDYREVHYAKVLLDQIFGRECFINEIIWAYDYGARATKRWSPKHDNILWYAKDPENYRFNYDEIDRIPYMAPGLVGEEKAARGKTPTDAWWHTIVSPNGREKTGYPTQKPLGILRRIVSVHSNPGDRLLDFFAGSGTFGEAGASMDRSVVLVDQNPEAIRVMAGRLGAYHPTIHGAFPSGPELSTPPENAGAQKIDEGRGHRRASGCGLACGE